MNIKVEDLCYSISGHQILHNIDLAVRDKEFLGIIGPNGSGKSTFLKCLYRVLKPDTGKIYFEDRLLSTMSFKESALKVAVVAQHNFYNFDFSVLEVVMMGRSPHKKMMEQDTKADYEIAHAALDKVGMDGFGKRIFSSLSGGEQQRVVLARALAQQTDTLILDEPTNHLDIKYQLEIMDIVKNHECTTVAAVHDLNIAANYCDRLYAFKDGRVFGEGKPAEMLTESFIKELFDVTSYVERNARTGLTTISFQPMHGQRNI